MVVGRPPPGMSEWRFWQWFSSPDVRGMTNRFEGGSALRSAILVTGATYISFAAWLVLSMVVARSLGPKDYGHYAYLVWLSGTLTILYGNGLTLAAIRFVAQSIGGKDLQGAKTIHALLGGWFAISLVVVTAVFLVAYPWLQPADWTGPAWVFAVAAMVSGAAKADYLFGASISKGYGRFEVDAYTMNIMSLAGLAGALVLAYLGAPLIWFIWYFVAVSIGHGLVTRALMRRAGISAERGPIAPDLRSRIGDLYFWTAILFLVFAFSNKSVETVLLNHYVGPEAVGWFAIGAALTRGGVDLLSSGLNSVLLPMMSHAFGSSDEARAHRIVRDAIRYSAVLGVMLAGLGVLWAAPVIAILYGAEFEPAVIGLQVMMLVGALTMPGSATSSLLMTTDRMGVRVGLAVGTVVLTLAVAVFFVPRYGFTGALAAHATAQLIMFVAGMAVIVKLLKVQLPYGALLRTLAAAALGLFLAGLMLAVSQGLIGQVAAGIAYAAGVLAGSVLFGVWTTNDVRLLADLLKRWPRLSGAASWLERYARLV